MRSGPTGHGGASRRRALSVVVAIALVLQAVLGAAAHAGARAAAVGDGVWIHVCSVEGDRYVLVGDDGTGHADGHAEGPRHCPMCLAKAVAPPIPGAPIPTDASPRPAAGPASTEADARPGSRARVLPPPHGPPFPS
jgi:hypothetical protein